MFTAAAGSQVPVPLSACLRNSQTGMYTFQINLMSGQGARFGGKNDRGIHQLVI